MEPQRIQLERTKGCQMPENTVSVTRGKFRNPFDIKHGLRLAALDKSLPEFSNQEESLRAWGNYAAHIVVREFKTYLEANPELIKKAKKELRGKNIACFCKIDSPCHADVLLEIANQ